jgi:hypothetical protein
LCLIRASARSQRVTISEKPKGLFDGRQMNDRHHETLWSFSLVFWQTPMRNTQEDVITIFDDTACDAWQRVRVQGRKAGAGGLRLDRSCVRQSMRPNGATGDRGPRAPLVLHLSMWLTEREVRSSAPEARWRALRGAGTAASSQGLNQITGGNPGLHFRLGPHIQMFACQLETAWLKDRQWL